MSNFYLIFHLIIYTWLVKAVELNEGKFSEKFFMGKLLSRKFLGKLVKKLTHLTNCLETLDFRCGDDTNVKKKPNQISLNVFLRLSTHSSRHYFCLPEHLRTHYGNVARRRFDVLQGMNPFECKSFCAPKKTRKKKLGNAATSPA